MIGTETTNTGRCASLSSALLWMLVASGVAAADAPPLVLEHLTTADGLPQATVMTALQDSQGFVWLGTEDGLVRFDGHELWSYARSRTDKGSLPGNYIWQVVEDTDANLWVAINDAGVAKWDRRTNRFTSIRHEPNDSASLASDRVRTILVDRRGFVWVGTVDAGVDVLDQSSGVVEHLRHAPSDPDSLAGDHVFALALDRAGDVWIGTDRGLNHWHASTRTLTRVELRADAALSLNDVQISRIVEDEAGTLWLATFNAGLIRIDRDGLVLGAFRHDPGDAASLPSDDVRALVEDQAGRLWVGTSDGLALLDRSNGGFSHYRHDASDGASLRDSFVMSLYQDPAGLLWIGTRTGGVSRWDPRSWELGGHRPAWLENQPVMAFADAPEGKVWIASLNGLVRFDPATGAYVSIDTIVGREKALGDERITSLRVDRRGALWIGTMGSGLRVLNPDGRLEWFQAQPDDPASLSAAGIMTILESRSGMMWIGTFGGGVNLINPVTRSVSRLPVGVTAGAVSAPNVTAIAEDARGNFWIGTEGGGLDLARADGTVLQVLQHDPADPSTLPSNTVYALAVDAEGQVWVGTDGGGLARIVEPARPLSPVEFEVLTRDDGLSSDTLYGVVPDARGRVWLSGNAGLMRLDPATGEIKTYHREHGLQGEEFSFGAYFRFRDDRVAFGGPGGFNIFDPDELSQTGEPPRVALTNIDVLGVRAEGETPFWLRDRVSLDYRASIVSLDFGVFDFTSPAHNRLSYRMAGLTDDWIDLGTERRITLTNLDSGNHVLEVRAATSDSAWSTTPLRLTIHRDPAPWASPTAYAIYVIAFLAFAAGQIRRHRRKFQEMVQARERLESKVAARTRELTESNRRLAEAAQAKSDFLDRMSHELRTPMNGVVGMTELLSRTQMSPTQSHLTSTIRSSAQVLLQIVNDLLDLSKMSAGKLALETLPIDLGQLLEECTGLFAGAAEAKGIELVVCPLWPAPQHVLHGDPLRVRQVLMNLIGNAVKFTEQGDVVVKADIHPGPPDHEIVELSVADTGIGMDPGVLDKIFEPFAQSDETTTRRFGGTGLGLAICRELTDLMGGRLVVESQPQIGSTFRLSLPLKRGTAVDPMPRRFAGRRVRIQSRRPSLAESLARQASLLGFEIVTDHDDTEAADVVVLDAGTYPNTLDSLLASSDPACAALIVIASAAEVEVRQLRPLLSDAQIVLKPVRQTALRAAFAAVLDLQVSGDAELEAMATPCLEGHVLLVEDEHVNAAVAQGYLEALGCTSVWVESGLEAVARIAAERFDLILLDLSMPGMDGFATAGLIRQQQSRAANRDGAQRIPIIALTAHDAAHYRDKCHAAGIDAILSKPYTLEDCRRLLERWLQPGATAALVAGIDDAVKEPTEDPAELVMLTNVDPDAVAALRQLQPGRQTDLYAKLVALFRVSSTQSLKELKAALDQDDLPAAAAVCHKLASAASNVGALAYGRRVKELEKHCLAGDGACASEACQALQAAHQPLLDTLLGQSVRAIA